MTNFLDTYFSVFFPFFFLGILVLVSFILSRSGYHNLVKKYRYDSEFFGNRIGLIYAKIDYVQYNNSLILLYNEKGIALKALFLFRLFHPPIFIPYSEIKSTKPKKILFTNYMNLNIGNPSSTDILLKIKVFNQFEKYYNNRI